MTKRENGQFSDREQGRARRQERKAKRDQRNAFLAMAFTAPLERRATETDIFASRRR